MRLPLPPEIQPTNEILGLIAAIDEFKGEWRARGDLDPANLRALRRIATIESAGSSTRIEGANLTDAQVETLISNLGQESFRSRDEQEVAGYAHTQNTVQSDWQHLPVTGGILLQLHRDLLRFSQKDERHRGHWKTLDNHVAAFDPQGNEIGVIFETASPFETPRLMDDLLAWHAAEEASPVLHPLLRIAAFNVAFLAVHPFQDGNGRLSRVLTNLMLLRAGYDYAAYISLESVVEHNKDAYYMALRRTQISFAGDADWQPWLLFFLRALTTQVGQLRTRLGPAAPQAKSPAQHPELSPLAGRLLDLLVSRGTLSVGEAAGSLGANRHTLKDKFNELVSNGRARLHGKGRGAHYRPVPAP